MFAQRSRMIGLALLLAVSTVLAACSSSATSTPTQAPANPGGAIQNAVAITNFAFSPAEISVPAGTKVTWTNNDSAAHTVTADDGKAFDSGQMAQGATFSFTFNTVGVFAYHCTNHPMMKAKVTVIP
jgi:plastocyanin